MPAKVVDASAVGALVCGEPEGARIARRLRECRLFAPALLPFEVGSICLKKLQQRAEQRESLLQAFEIFSRMAIQRVEVDHPGVILLAERTGLTSYDASYLWLAQELDAELVTLDRRLGAAAARK